MYEQQLSSVIATASLSTSIFPIFILFFCPSKPSRTVLDGLLMFAAGGLLGDAFLHLLPHASENRITDPFLASLLEEYHVSLPHLLVVAGLLLFHVLEGLLGGNDCEEHGKEHKPKGASPAQGQCLSHTARLNLLADTVHNFTDGMAIAASFASSLQLGVSTTLAVMVHELPHEIGDYAVLLGGGFDKSAAISFQGLTGLGNLAGALFVGLCGERADSAMWVLPLAAGGFIYIAVGGILTPLSARKRGFLEVVGGCLLFIMGVLSMVVIGMFE